MNKQLPWFAFYPRDFLDGVMMMTNEQTGVYIKLISALWLRGPLPDRPEALARIAGVEPTLFERDIWPELQPHFVQDDQGRWINPRMEAERSKANEISEKRREAVRKRWTKSTDEMPEKAVQMHNPSRTEEEQIACNPHTIVSSNADANDHNSTQYTVITSSLRSDDAPAHPPKMDCRPPPDPRDRLFQTGLANVSRLTGIPAKRCRGLIGKWLKDCHDDASILNAIIVEAVETRPAEPVAWIVGAIRYRNPPGLAVAAESFGLADIDLDAPLRRFQEENTPCLH